MTTSRRDLIRQAGGGTVSPVGLGVLVPGLAHWNWRQAEKATAFAGTFAAALFVAIFAWGTRLGLAMVGLAFLTHVLSVADAIRQAAFPGFGRWIPGATAGVGLGVGCYAPALVVASSLAWTDAPTGADNQLFAVNRWAFRASVPGSGDWVWYRTPNGPGCGLGRVVAGPGSAVEFVGKGLTVDGRPLGWQPPEPADRLDDLSLTVPDGQVLIAPMSSDPAARTSIQMRLIGTDGVVGRPWARLYPVWSRRLLF